MYATPFHTIRRRGVQIVRSDSEQLRALGANRLTDTDAEEPHK